MKRFFGVIAIVAMIALIVDYSFGVRTFGDVMIAVAPAASIIDDTVTIAKGQVAAPTMYLSDIDQEVVKIDPSRFPLDTILRQMARSRKVESQITKFYSRDYKSFHDTVTTLVTGAAQTSFNVVVANISTWSLHDTIMFNKVPAYAQTPAANTVNPIASLACYINLVNKGTSTLTVQPMNGKIVGGVQVLPVGDNIAATTKVIRLGRAEAELSMQTSSYAIFPESETNNCQNFMAQIEQSTFDALTKKEVSWNFTDFEEANIKDMKAQKELSFLFGARSEIIDSQSNDRIYTCGGATEFLTKSLQWVDADFASAAAADAWFVALTKKVFQGNSGAQIRYAFFGPDLMEKINAVPIVQKQLDSKNVEVKFGLTFNEIVSTFGLLRVIKHDLLGEVGYGDKGFVFDVSKMEYHKFIALQETELDLKHAGTKNARAKVIQEVSCPVYKYPDTHLYLYKV